MAGASFLDGRGARLLAAAVLLVCIAGLALYHRDALLAGGGPDVPSTGNPELDGCIAERAGQADRLAADGLISADEVPAFRERAIAFCEQTVGG